MKKINKRALMVLLLSVALYGCTQTTPSHSELIDQIKTLYAVEITKTNLNSSREISIAIREKETDELRLYVTYNSQNNKNNCIIFYNDNPNIPVKLYYALEPSEMYYEERLSYEAFRTELEREYQIFLKQFGDIGNDDLMQLAKQINLERQ